MKITIKNASIEELKKTKVVLNNFRLWCKVTYDTTFRLMFDDKVEKNMELDIKDICLIMQREVEQNISKLENPNRRIWICIEARWSGYTSNQSRVVHREYRKIKHKDLLTYIEKAKESHRFGDNTCNYYNIHVVDKKNNDEIHGYNELVQERFG